MSKTTPNTETEAADRLTSKQRAAVAALLTARNITDAAKAAGVPRRTLTGWLAEPVFAAELRAAEAEVVAQAVRRLTNATGQAIDTLTDALDDALTPAAVRVRAADIILGRVLTMRELVELEARIAAIEAMQAGGNGK